MVPLETDPEDTAVEGEEPSVEQGGDSDTGETDDTFLPIDTGDSSNGGETGLQALGCHPYDPMTTSGWERRYSITEGGRSGTEIHRGQGLLNVPSNWPNNAWATEGYAYTVNINFQGANNPPLTTYYNQCQAGASGDVAVEVGYSIVNGAQDDIVSAATAPRTYLPSEQQFSGFGWSDQSEVSFRLFAPELKIDPFSCIPNNPPCIRVSRYTLATTNNVATEGEEQLNLPAIGGSVSAQKITYVIEQQVTKQGSGNPFNIFGEIFGSIFSVGGYQADGDRYYAEITRWYVRGVGLVKEEAVDINDGSVIASKQITQCSGLPGC